MVWRRTTKANSSLLSPARETLTRLFSLVPLCSTAALPPGVVRTTQVRTPIPSVSYVYHPLMAWINVLSPCLSSDPAVQKGCVVRWCFWNQMSPPSFYSGCRDHQTGAPFELHWPGMSFSGQIGIWPIWVAHPHVSLHHAHPSPQDHTLPISSFSSTWSCSLSQVTGSPQVDSHQTPGSALPASVDFWGFCWPSAACGLNFIKVPRDCWDPPTSSGLNFVDGLGDGWWLWCGLAWSQELVLWPSLHRVWTFHSSHSSGRGHHDTRTWVTESSSSALKVPSEPTETFLPLLTISWVIRWAVGTKAALQSYIHNVCWRGQLELSRCWWLDQLEPVISCWVCSLDLQPTTLLQCQLHWDSLVWRLVLPLHKSMALSRIHVPHTPPFRIICFLRLKYVNPCIPCFLNFSGCPVTWSYIEYHLLERLGKPDLLVWDVFKLQSFWGVEQQTQVQGLALNIDQNMVQELSKAFRSLQQCWKSLPGIPHHPIRCLQSGTWHFWGLLRCRRKWPSRWATSTTGPLILTAVGPCRRPTGPQCHVRWCTQWF